MTAMLWVMLGIAAVVAAAVALAATNSRRFAGRVAAETRVLWATIPEPRPVDRAQMAKLPSPVRAYLFKALGGRARTIRTVRFRHGGRFRTKLEGAWRPIRGEQYDAADPPGFVWWGRLDAGPGLWVDALDRSVNGQGGMRVALESTVTLFDRSGPELDQGSLLRLLSDFVLFPTVLLDERYISWTAVDEKRAKAALRVGDREVSGVFEFGADGLPRAFHADRYYDTGKGQPELRPWSGDYLDYRTVDGLLMPFHYLGYWHVDGQRIAYVDFELETPEIDATAPFR
jgi:hypothetical protein